MEGGTHAWPGSGGVGGIGAQAITTLLLLLLGYGLAMLWSL